MVQINDRVTEITDAVNRLRKFRQQLSGAELANEKEKLDAVEGTLTRLPGMSSGMFPPMGLNNRLGSLSGVVQQADGRPTQSMYAVFKELSHLTAAQLNLLDQITPKTTRTEIRHCSGAIRYGKHDKNRRSSSDSGMSPLKSERSVTGMSRWARLRWGRFSSRSLLFVEQNQAPSCVLRLAFTRPSILLLMPFLRTITTLDPADLSGTVIAVPVVNSTMFRTRSPFISPIDGLNLNRTFPGRADGTITETLAHILLNEVVMQSDFHIDCHGGDLSELLLPYCGCPLHGNPEADAHGEAMARLYSPRIVALYREGSTLPPTKGSLVNEASRRGIPSILTESGSAGGLDPSHVEVHMNGTRNVMRYLKMIPGDPVVRGDRMVAKDQFVVSARHVACCGSQLVSAMSSSKAR